MYALIHATSTRVLPSRRSSRYTPRLHGHPSTILFCAHDSEPTITSFASTSELSFPFGLSASDSVTETDETGVRLAPLGARFSHSLQHTPVMLAVPWLKVALTLLVIMAPYTRSLHQ